jgi:aminopeptidase-like protein
LSGIAIATHLAAYFSQVSRRYSYRFIFIPATIGSITWLSQNEDNTGRIKHGLVLSCLGDPGKSTYKKSRRGNAEIDQAIIHILQTSQQDYEVIDFIPYGYDERQYCSPGFDLPVGCFMRTPNGKYAEYHTSADNLGFVRPDCLADSLHKCLSIFSLLEDNRIYLNQNPKCEPQLGKRGIYQAVGGGSSRGFNEMAMLWVLNLSDGHYSLLDIAQRSGMAFSDIRAAASLLLQHGLLKESTLQT